MFAAGLPFPVAEILELKAIRDSEKFSSNFPRIFPELPKGPRNSHSLLEFSEKFARKFLVLPSRQKDLPQNITRFFPSAISKFKPDFTK